MCDKTNVSVYIGRYRGLSGSGPGQDNSTPQQRRGGAGRALARDASASAGASASASESKRKRKGKGKEEGKGNGDATAAGRAPPPAESDVIVIDDTGSDGYYAAPRGMGSASASAGTAARQRWFQFERNNVYSWYEREFQIVKSKLELPAMYNKEELRSELDELDKLKNAKLEQLDIEKAEEAGDGSMFHIACGGRRINQYLKQVGSSAGGSSSSCTDL